jgi:hypothetical protein
VQSHTRLAQMRAVCLSGVLYEYMYGVMYSWLQLWGRREQETQNGTNAGSRRRGGDQCAVCKRLTVVQREFSFFAPLEHLRRPAITIAAACKRDRGQTKGHPQEAMVKATSCRGELQAGLAEGLGDRVLHSG